MVEILLEFVAPARKLHRPASESGVSLCGPDHKNLNEGGGPSQSFWRTTSAEEARGALSYKIPGSWRQPGGSSGCEPRFTSCEVPSEDASDSQVAS
jgi:hypothetical protein